MTEVEKLESLVLDILNDRQGYSRAATARVIASAIILNYQPRPVETAKSLSINIGSRHTKMKVETRST